MACVHLCWRKLRWRVTVIVMVTTLTTVLVVQQLQNDVSLSLGDEREESGKDFAYPNYSLLAAAANRSLLAGSRHRGTGAEDTAGGSYERTTPLIWVGGVPRSGTTLMRVMLDAHPDVRCGEETRVIPRILEMHRSMIQSDTEMQRLREAKVTEEVLNEALARYILSIIVGHGRAAARLCNKDPLALRSMPRLLKMFPASRFILMVRDGRAVAHSIVTRKVTIKGFDIQSYRGALTDWNRLTATMYADCLALDDHRCLVVHYEQLVLHPRPTLHRVLDFLNLGWHEGVMHHSELISDGEISLSRKELSTDQVNRPVNTAALTSWASHIPDDVRRDIRSLAPMLITLGYDPDAYPPHYGDADSEVLLLPPLSAASSVTLPAAN